MCQFRTSNQQHLTSITSARATDSPYKQMMNGSLRRYQNHVTSTFVHVEGSSAQTAFHNKIEGA
jgi:hypothetical protein